MTHHTAASHVPAPEADAPSGEHPGLDWLLDDFVGRVAGAHAAVLASGDGLPMAAGGLPTDQADIMAAVMSSQISMAKGVGGIANTSGGRVRQVVVERDDVYMFVMSAGDSPPPMPAGTDAGTVGCVLGVLAAPDCDVRVVGYEMAALITSVDEHLVTARRGESHSGGQ